MASHGDTVAVAALAGHLVDIGHVRRLQSNRWAVWRLIGQINGHWSVMSAFKMADPWNRNNNLQNINKLKRPCSLPLPGKWWQMELKLPGD